MFFIWDEDSYHLFMESINGQMKEGESFLADVPVEERGVIEEGKIYTWEYDYRRLDYESVFPKKLYFGVRAPIGTAADSRELYEQALKLLENFITAKDAAQ